MSYCINPKCKQRQNPDELDRCQACDSSLIINERYRLVRPLRELSERHPSEVFEVDYLGTPKVLKVLPGHRQKLVELFQREAQVLQQLKHAGIPTVDNYFIFSLSNGKELHCLVMEKIEGQNLKQWLEENGSISEALAIDWLRQLATILAQVHQEQLLHRDIKPSNIMLRPDGQLMLIDFGTVRELTSTYAEKLNGQDVTRVYAPGYTAMEQYDGQSVAQSDFFALGRTFVHLLTTTHPDNLPKNSQTHLLEWRQAAPVSDSLANLIDDLMAPLPNNRPQNTQVILERLAAISGEGATSTVKAQNPIVNSSGQEQGDNTRRTDSITPSRRHTSWLQRFPTVLLVSTVVTVCAIGRRYLGVLQPLELQAYDQMLQLRPEEGADPRLLIVTITEADIRTQKQRNGSLSDSALAQLLEKLEQDRPRIIGLDIYRDFPVEPAYRNLATRLRQDEHFIGVCKDLDPEADPEGVPPPPEIPPERVGFSDFVNDADGVLRRQFLSMTPEPASPCQASYSLSALLALNYLAAQGILPKFNADGNLQLGKVVLPRLKTRSGGYQKVDAGGNQVLLNYRSHSPQKIAAQVTLTQVLNDQFNPKSVQDRIVLIGATGTTAGDRWSTPYGAGPNDQVPGVFMQAQMVSQILSAALDGRPLLRVWPAWDDVLWIWGWSAVGSLLACCFQSRLRLGLAGGTALGVLFGLCFSLFLNGVWVPLVPSAIALIAAVGSVKFYTAFQAQNNIRQSELQS